MKLLLTFFIFLSLSQQILACDAALEKFPRDCAIHDRLASLRQVYAAKGLNLDEIGEYKVLRFIDRSSWEKAKLTLKAPLQIYDPAPTTWKVWESGVDSLFSGYFVKNTLTNGFDLNKNSFAKINTVLLTSGTTSIKDIITDQNKKPGEYRNLNDKPVGFCVEFGRTDAYRAAVNNSEDSMQRYLKTWESKAGVLFSDVVKNEKGPAYNSASLNAGMKMSTNSCNNGRGIFFRYADSKDVSQQIEWIRIFIQKNITSDQDLKISPIELAAVVQKWFVSVHPFADGNGRTSRAVQEIIMVNYGLPFIPAGDLQNDALSAVETYIESTYLALEKMLTTLEDCVLQREQSLIPRACRTIQELNEKGQEMDLINHDLQMPGGDS